MTYDPTEVQTLADKLEARADQAVFSYPVTIGALAGLAASWWWLPRGQYLHPIGAAILGAIVGFRLGQMRALSLRAQAQSLLCQLKIEENTRK